jgi:Fe-S-cluster containining protein
MLGMKVSREHLNAATTAAYEHTAAALGSSREPGACAAVCRRLNGVIDEEFAAATNAGAAIACAPGCDYCCHLRVGVFPHEAAAMLDYLRTRATPAQAAAIEQRIRANAQRIDGLTVEQHRAAVIPCAFLTARRCSAHDVRPSACATHHSLSRERCEHAFRHPHDIGTPRTSRPALLDLQVFGTALIEATQAGSKAAGGSGEQIELHQAMRALLDAGVSA